MDAISLIGTIGTAIFGITSAVQYFLSKNRKKIGYVYSFSTIQSKNHKDLTLNFKGKEIGNLNKLTVAAYNCGNSPIKEGDLPKKQSVAIIFPQEFEILSHNILVVSDPNCGFSTNINDEKIVITFEYLNSNDGGILEILYETKENQQKSIRFIGKIIGGEMAKVIKFNDYASIGSRLYIPISVSLTIAMYIPMLIRNRTYAIPVFCIWLFFGLLWIGKTLKKYYDHKIPNSIVNYFRQKDTDWVSVE